MQKILPWTLLTFLLVCVIGCGEKNYQSVGESANLEVDGVQYIVGWKIWMDRQGRVTQSFLTVYPPFYPVTLMSHMQIEKTHLPMRPNGEKVFAKTDTLYFIQDGEVVFAKEYQELGIDTSRFDIDNKAGEMLDYLRPILENLIREHVQPQEAEREGQEP
jgi:hypothetical protein